jgi:hypothetical protein
MLQAAALQDPRLSGDLRRAALIVVGEFALDRQTIAAAREARLSPLLEALDAEDWPRTLELLKQVSEADAAKFRHTFWNDVAWRGLTEVPAGSPARDLNLLLRYAERAAEGSKRADGNSLDTLARAHWELGDKPKAIEVQREAVAAAEASLPTMKDEETSARAREALDEMKATLATYERDQPPAPPAAFAPGGDGPAATD